MASPSAEPSSSCGTGIAHNAPDEETTAMCLMQALPRNARTLIRLSISLRYRLCGTLPARTAARRAVAAKRQFFDVCELEELERRVRITATATDAVARAIENEKAPEDGGFQVSNSDIAGAGFEPATFGL
jgi:hypothetical protein